MTITAQGAIAGTGTASGTTLTFTLAPTAVNNVVCLFSYWDTTNSRTLSIATASAGILWTPAIFGRFTYTGLAKFGQGFYGVAQSTTSRVTTLTWSGAATNMTFEYQEFHSSLATPVWSEVASGENQSSVNVTSMAGASLVCGTGNLYAGFWFTGGTGNASGGTANYVFQLDGGTNVYGYRLSTAGTESPNAIQSSGHYNQSAIALTDVAPVVQSGPVPFISGYSGMFYHREHDDSRSHSGYRAARERRLSRPGNRPEQRDGSGMRRLDRAGLRWGERRGGVRVG